MTVAEATALARELVHELSDVPHTVMVAPPFTALAAVADVLRGSSIRLGAQNMGPAESGAHTGEISPAMLTDLGASAVIIGHSERRHTYGESDELINEKMHLALAYGLLPILCVGETLDEREADRAETVVKKQVEAGLSGISSDQMKRITVAYEPVWAIGTGRTATPEDADEIHAVIRRILAERYSQSVAESAVIQYGGSVKPSNIAGLMAKENIDGALVGGASLSADKFVPIARFDRS